MGIGYASVNSVSLNLFGKVSVANSNGVIITEVSYESNNGADLSQSVVNSYAGTFFDNDVVFIDKTASTYITYKITLYNNDDCVYFYDEALYDKEQYTDIEFDVIGLELGTQINPNESLYFYVKFRYASDVELNETVNNRLESLIRFNFEKMTYPLLTNNMLPVYFENNDWKKADSSTNSWYNYQNGVWANAVTYNHDLAYNQSETVNNLKTFNGTSDYYGLGNEGYNFKNGFSAVARFKLASLSDSEYFIVGNSETAGFGITKSENNKISFSLYNSNIGAYSVIESDFILEIGVWYTAVATYDGRTAKLYVNGALIATQAFNCSYKTSNSQIMIGANPGSTVETPINGGYFHGIISEAAIFTSVLSESKISSNYNSVIKHDYEANNILSHVKFSGEDGSLKNGAFYSDEGIVFDGVDDYLSVGYSGYNFNKNITVGVRFKVNNLNSSNKTIFGNPDPNTGGFHIAINTSNKVMFSFRNASTNSWVNAASTYALTPGVWYTVVGTYDGNTIKLYINGTLNSTKSTSGNIKTSSSVIGIGGRLSSSGINESYYTNCVVSDSVVVTETLSANQIKQYYSSDLTTVISGNTLVSYNLRGWEGRAVGTVIPKKMINTMWVWIPRFSMITPTTTNETVRINFVETDEKAHDAFTFGANELSGIWVGKFENSSDNISSAQSTLTGNVQIIPNRESFRNKNVATLYNSIKNMELSNNVYGFNTSIDDELDLHMIKSNEWAAVSFLTYSKYGIGNNESMQIQKNNTTYLTGGVNYINNVEQSTTGNIYGIYDMYGGVDEYVMGNYLEAVGSSGFSSMPNDKYYNKYLSEDDYLFKNMQHALIETNGFYNNLNSSFVDSTNMWLIRNGLFTYTNGNGVADDTIGTRTVLTID